MQTCENCKWWSSAYSNHGNICDFVNTIHADKDKNTLFILEYSADDDQGLTVFVRTGPNFGCVHFASI
jgi:hypothetical protein